MSSPGLDLYQGRFEGKLLLPGADSPRQGRRNLEGAHHQPPQPSAHIPQPHAVNYVIESDGSQVNIINNKGTGAMIPPGGTYIYEFRPEQPDVTYYHCHAADKDFAINQHIIQGLYGFIVVEDPKPPAMREDVLVMAEIGSATKGNNVPPYIMNGLGVPGGELTLETIYKAQGLQGIVKQLN